MGGLKLWSLNYHPSGHASNTIQKRYLPLCNGKTFILTCGNSPSELLQICVHDECWTDLAKAEISLL